MRLLRCGWCGVTKKVMKESSCVSKQNFLQMVVGVKSQESNDYWRNPAHKKSNEVACEDDNGEVKFI